MSLFTWGKNTDTTHSYNGDIILKQQDRILGCASDMNETQNYYTLS